jgi:outer membrane protein assembly factor BamB
MNKRPFLVVFILFSLTTLGCSHFKTEKNYGDFKFHKKWVRSTLKNSYLGFRHLHRMSPVLTPTLVIAGNAVDGLSAHDRKSGHLVWQLNIRFGVEAGAKLVDGNLFFGASDGHFYSVNAETGQVNWTFPIRSEGLGRPFVKDGTVYFLAGNNTLYALSAANGQKKWIYSRNEFKSLSVRGGSTPVVYAGQLYIGFSDGYFVSINAKTGQLRWEKLINGNRRFMDVDAPPVVSDGKVYVSGFDDQLICLNLTDGSLVWRVDQGGYNSVTVYEDKVIYPTTHKQVLVLDKKSGKTLWAYTLKEGFATAVGTYKGLMIFGESEGSLKAIDLQTQKEVASFNPGRGLASEPSIDQKTGAIFFMSRQANLFSLKLNR